MTAIVERRREPSVGTSRAGAQQWSERSVGAQGQVQTHAGSRASEEGGARGSAGGQCLRVLDGHDSACGFHLMEDHETTS